ncbi:MAG: hypothetical protein KIT84_10380 [Labilithrix sp.]|nr:hypothetical protein [Labilithrix sp.]MCW5811411.1 hypothetical protein [Labilithrix sp.]
MAAMDFKIGKIPVQIQGRFFLMTLLLGLSERDPARLAVWVGVVLVSIVVHEMGHALMGMAFGYRPAIVLHGMGGHTSFGEGRWTETTGKSIAISFAGPLAGFVFAALIVGVQLAGFQPTAPLAGFALGKLLVVNIGWGIFNLFPMLPLDGGNIMRSFFRHFATRRGESIARVVSIVCAVAMGLWAATSNQWWLLYLAALFGFQNVQAFRNASSSSSGPAYEKPAARAVEESYGALNRGDTKRAIALLQPVIFGRNVDVDTRRAGLEVYVVSLIKEERWSDVVRALERDREIVGPSNLKSYAGLLRKAGRDDEAARVEALGKQAAAFGEFRA